MMGATRRQFLSGAAAATAGVALLDVRASAKKQHDDDRQIDEQVAISFFTRPHHQDPTEATAPRLVSLLYGLICTDLSGSEALLPNPVGITDVKAHVARLWVETSAIDTAAGNPAPDGTDTGPKGDGNGAGSYSYFDIAGYTLRFKALDSSGNQVPDPTTSLRKRERSQHPWMHFKWIRCLKQLTGLSLKDDDDLEKPQYTRTRVKLKTGRVAAIPPFSRDGQHREWKVTHNGNTAISATTDAMLWSRPLRAAAVRLAITLTPLESTTVTKTITLKVEDQRVLLVFAHATHDSHSDPTRQTDSKAFARLLKNGDPDTYPVPEIEGKAITGVTASASDVHCECASCP